MSFRIEKGITVLHGGTAIVPGTSTSPIGVDVGLGDWNLVVEPGTYYPTGEMDHRPFDGTKWSMRVAVLAGGSPPDIEQHAQQGDRGKSRVRRSGIWSQWVGWEDTLPSFVPNGNADRVAMQNIQTQQRHIHEVELTVTSGIVATTPNVYGWSIAPSTATQTLPQGGDLARVDGGELSDVPNHLLVAMYSTSAATPVSKFRFKSFVNTLIRVKIGDTEYALTRTVNNSTVASWGDFQFDEYEISSSETNRDPLGFSATGVTKNGIQFFQSRHRPLYTATFDEERSFDLYGLQALTGHIAQRVEIESLQGTNKVLETAYSLADERTIHTFRHHPRVSVTGMTSAIIDLENQHYPLRLVRGDTRIFGADESPGEEDLGRRSQTADELVDFTLQNYGITTETVKDGLLVMEFGTLSRVIFNMNSRRMETAAAGDLEIPRVGQRITVRYFPTGSAMDVVDGNFVAENTSGGASAAKQYRIYGSPTAIQALKDHHVAYVGRGDLSILPTLKTVGPMGAIHSLNVDSMGAVSTDTANSAYRYVDLTINAGTAPRPSRGSAVVLGIPKASDSHPDSNPDHVRTPLEWTEDLSGIGIDPLSPYPGTIYLPWPEEANVLRLTMNTPQISGTSGTKMRIQYLTTGTPTRFDWVLSRTSDGPIEFTSGASHTYEFHKDSFRFDDKLKLRMVAVDATGDPSGAVNFGSGDTLKAKLEYLNLPNIADETHPFIGSSQRVIKTAKTNNIAGTTMTNISFGRAIEIARIDEIAMRVNPDSDQGETQGAGERIIRLTRADIDIGDLFGAGSFTLPTSTTAKMAVLLFLGLADNLREPMAGPSRAFIAGVSSDPVMILSMVEDGVYATGVGIACFNVDHNILAGQVRFI